LKFRTTLLASAFAMLPAASMATTEDFLEGFAVTAADTGAARVIEGDGLSFSSSDVGDGKASFSDAVIRIGHKTIKAYEMVVDDAGIHAKGVVVAAEKDGEAYARLDIADMTVSGPQATQLMMAPPFDNCLPGEDLSGMAEIEPTVISFGGLQAEAPQTPAAPAEFERLERIHVETGEAAVRLSAAGNCLEVVSASGTGMRIGDHLGAIEFDRVTLAQNSFPAEGDARDINANIEGGRIVGSSGEVIASFDGAGFHGWLSPAFDDLIANGGILSDLSGAVNRLLSTKGAAGTGVEFTGVMIDVRRMFDESQLDMLGLGDVEQITGDVGFALAAGKEAEDAQIDALVDIDLEGLAAFRFDASLVQIEDLQEAGSDIRAAGLSLATVMAIKSGQVSFKDKGLVGTLETSAGMDRQGLQEVARGILRDLPASLRTPVLEWVSRAMESGASVVVAPEKPMPLIQAGVMAAMSPSLLAKELRLTVD